MSDLEAEFAEFVVSFVLRIFILALHKAKVSNEAQVKKKKRSAGQFFGLGGRGERGNAGLTSAADDLAADTLMKLGSKARLALTLTYFLAKICVDRAENERKFAKNWQLPYRGASPRPCRRRGAPGAACAPSPAAPLVRSQA